MRTRSAGSERALQSTYEYSVGITNSDGHNLRKFTNENHHELAVKSPIRSIFRRDFVSESAFRTEIRMRAKEVNEELALLRRAYPDEKISEVFTYVSNPGDPLAAYWSFRLVMNYFNGVTLEDYYTQIKDYADLLALMLAVALELQGIHENGVLHGDLHARNVLVRASDRKVKIIDFGLGYRISSRHACVTENESALYWPPERRVTEDDPVENWVAPNFKQDVFSLGWMMRDMIRRCAGLEKPQVELYHPTSPTLFIKLGRTLETLPDSRPSLGEVIQEIRCEQEQQISANMKCCSSSS